MQVIRYDGRSGGSTPPHTAQFNLCLTQKITTMNVFERINQQLLAGCEDSKVEWHQAWCNVVDPNCIICRDEEDQEIFDYVAAIVLDYKKRGPKINIVESDKATYNVEEDLITCPCREQFTNDADYCCTLFHEMIHSTGKRLGRAMQHEKHAYCEEELIAELGALYLCGIVGYNGGETFEQSVAYVKGYRSQTNASDDELLLLASQALRAVDLILGE